MHGPFAAGRERFVPAQAGGVGAVLAAARHAPGDAGLQRQACFALWSLSSMTKPGTPGHDPGAAARALPSKFPSTIIGVGAIHFLVPSTSRLYY